MIIKNVKTLDGQTTDLRVSAATDKMIDAEGNLFLFPAAIDPHLSLGSPSKKEWKWGVECAVRGGVGSLLDIPTKDAPSATAEELQAKKKHVDTLLKEMKMPFNYYPYMQGSAEELNALGGNKSLTLGCLVLFNRDDDLLEDSAWDRMFQAAAWKDLPIIVNSRGESGWGGSRFLMPGEGLLEKAIHYAEKQSTRLYVFNVSSEEELALIQEGRKKELLIYAETTPSHLFPSHGGNVDFLWEALNQGAIESIGTGYHFDDERSRRVQWRGADLAFSNPIFFFPLLLTAYHDKKISLEKIVRATRINYYDIFNLERAAHEFVLIDLEKEEVVQISEEGRHRSMSVKGWPKYTLLNGELFHLPEGGYHVERVE